MSVAQMLLHVPLTLSFICPSAKRTPFNGIPI